jgi:O-antigen ligase
MPQIDIGRRRTGRTPAARGGGRAITLALVTVVAWGVLAFGAVYPWAYWPLLAASAVLGVAAFGTGRPADPLTRTIRPVLAGLVAVAAAALLQMVPLPLSVRTTMSPATEPFLLGTDVPYAASVALNQHGAAGSSAAPRRPLSIDPEATARAVALLGGFTLLLAGLNRHFGRNGVRAVVPALIALGVLVAIVGIVQKALLGDHAFGGMKIYGVWAPRYKLTTPFGPFVNRNHYAGWMLMTLPLAVGYLMGLAETGAARVRPGWRDRFLWLSSPEGGKLQLTAFAIVMMAAALALTRSRSGIACFAVTLAAAAIAVTAGRRITRARLAIVGALLVLVALPTLWANVDLVSRFTSGGESLELRRQAWRDAATIVRDFPLTGTGLNSYGRATLLYNTAQTDLHFQEAHNDYLQLAAEGGLLIGIPALVAIVACARGTRRRLREDANDPMRHWVRFGAAAGMGAIALQSAVEFSLQMPGNAVLFVVLCAIALHRGSSAGEPDILPRVRTEGLAVEPRLFR